MDERVGMMHERAGALEAGTAKANICEAATAQRVRLRRIMISWHRPYFR
jgi:hypothetical protein